MSVRDAVVARDRRAPTEAAPESGRAMLHVGDRAFVLSEAVRWMEPDGHYVIRSAEFDVIVGAPTFEAAFTKFIDGLFDFAAYLGELEDLADNEEQMFHILASRLVGVSKELERNAYRCKRPFISVNLPRRRRGRRDGIREWQPSSRQRGLQAPSHA